MTISFDSLDLRQVDVNIQGKPYLLREATGQGAVRFRSAAMRGTRLGKDGLVEHLENTVEAELILVNECLVDASGRRTPIQVLQGWPARIIKALFIEAKRISELDEADSKAEEEKMDPTLPAGSDSPVTCGFPSDGSFEPPPNGS